MTEDPIKLYVVVMSILLAVLGFVTYAVWQQSDAIEQAIERAPRQDKDFKELASEVSKLCEQLKQSKVQMGYVSLIEAATKYNRVETSKIGQDPREPRIGTNGKEKRFRVEFRGRSSEPLTRERVAKLCQSVENDSRGILKTIEIELSRDANTGDGRAGGKDETIKDDRYNGLVIFGLRYVE